MEPPRWKSAGRFGKRHPALVQAEKVGLGADLESKRTIRCAIVGAPAIGKGTALENLFPPTPTNVEPLRGVVLSGNTCVISGGEFQRGLIDNPMSRRLVHLLRKRNVGLLGNEDSLHR
jgi:hypothetical protein